MSDRMRGTGTSVMMPWVLSWSNPDARIFSAREPRRMSTMVEAPTVRPRCPRRATQLTIFKASVVASISSNSSRQLPQLPQCVGASSPK